MSGPPIEQQSTSGRVSTLPEPATHLGPRWVLLVAVGAIGLAIGAALAPGSTKTVTKPGPTVTATPVVTKVVAARAVTGVSDGFYKIGPDIPAGFYRTEGGEHCYYAVWASLNNDYPVRHDTSHKPSVVEVDRGEAFEVSGGCRWARVG